VDLQYSKEDEVFAAEVRDWLAEHLAGRFDALVGRGGSQNEEMFEERLEWERELHSGGWTGLGWPAEYGGRPATILQRILFEYEYARARAPYRVGFQGTNLIGPTLIAHGTEEQKRRFLPRILSGEDIWCQGFSEPGAGSDLASLTTRARLDGDRWVLDGQKVWTSHAHQAQWIYVLARTDPDAYRHRGLTMLLVPTEQPGVEVRPIRNMADGDEFNEVFFNGAETAADLVVGEVNGGWPVAMNTLEFERGTAMMSYQNQFESETAEIVRLFGPQLRAEPTLLRRMIDSMVELRVMGYSNLRTMSSLTVRPALGAETSIAKLVWPQWHQRLGELAMDLQDAAGVVVGPGYALNPQQRSYLVSRAESIYGGSQQVHLNIVAERLLGLPRDPRPAGARP
jgi:alkylation response protein AidB-like acyl-CoA dehydrogenase